MPKYRVRFSLKDAACPPFPSFLRIVSRAHWDFARVGVHVCARPATLVLAAMFAGSDRVAADAGAAIVTAEPGNGAAFIAGDQPVTENHVRQRLQSDGWSNVQIVRDGNYLEAIGPRNGQATKVAVDARTSRSRSDDDDD